MVESFDLVVIGGGPGGYVAAIRASQLGLKAAVVEREHLGGICLNWGCIPTKALLRSAEVFHLMNNAGAFGLSASNVSFDLAQVVQRSRAVAAQLQSGVKHLLRKNKVTVIEGHGRLAGKGRVAIFKNGKAGKPDAELAAKHIILATGARPRVLPGLEPDGRQVWTYKEAMVPPAMPRSLLVVGFKSDKEPKGIYSVSAKGEIKELAKDIGRLDGVYEMKDGTLLATDWNSGSLFSWSAKDGKQTLASGFRGPADFCVIPQAKGYLVVVPDLVKSELRMIQLAK